MTTTFKLFISAALASAIATAQAQTSYTDDYDVAYLLYPENSTASLQQFPEENTFLTEYAVPQTITHSGTEYTVTAIANSAFMHSQLQSISLPGTITSISAGAFNYCFNLVSITCLATTPPVLSMPNFASCGTGLTIYVPAASIDGYKMAWGTKYSAAGGDERDITYVGIAATAIGKPDSGSLSLQGNALLNPDGAMVSIYNVAGSLVAHSADRTISVADMPKGVYIAVGSKGAVKFVLK